MDYAEEVERIIEEFATDERSIDEAFNLSQDEAFKLIAEDQFEHAEKVSESPWEEEEKEIEWNNKGCRFPHALGDTSALEYRMEEYVVRRVREILSVRH